jgi:hypothetical protein
MGAIEDFSSSNDPFGSTVTVSDSAGEDIDDQSEIQEEEKCCICRQLTPDEVRNSVSLIFTKWVQCSNEDCKHCANRKFKRYELSGSEMS